MLERGGQVHFVGEFQALPDFPPTPKLNTEGQFGPGKVSKQELRGEKLFYDRTACAGRHAPPYFTDNLMCSLKVEHLYGPKLVNGMVTSVDGLIRTFPLHGIKDSPSYLHDDRLLILEDMTEFFSLVLERGLPAEEKGNPVAYLRTL